MEVPASCWQTSWGPFAASVSLVVPRSSPGLTCQSHGCRFDQRPFSLNSPMPWFSVLQTIRYNVLAPLLDLSSSDLSQVGEFSSKTLSFSSHLIPAKGTICVEDERDTRGRDAMPYKQHHHFCSHPIGQDLVASIAAP